MSQIPDEKYPKVNPFQWEDYQLKRLMDVNSELRKENKELKEKYDKLYRSYTEGTPTDGYEVGPYTESVEEPEGVAYTTEEIKNWEKEASKLSEEVVDNKNVKYIYESPDGGKTIYRRKFGEYGKRELVKDWNKEKENIING